MSEKETVYVVMVKSEASGQGYAPHTNVAAVFRTSADAHRYAQEHGQNGWEKYYVEARELR